MYLKTFVSLMLFLNVSKVWGLKENCTQNADCETTRAVCKLGRCDCDALSYPSRASDSCMPYAIEYKGHCEETDQCLFLGAQGVLCYKNRCSCGEGSRWWRGECRTVARKGGKCSAPSDCFDGYNPLALDCVSGVCACGKGYYDRGVDCRLESSNGSACMLDVDCQSDGLVCTRGKCVSVTLKVSDAVEEVRDGVVEEEPGPVRERAAAVGCTFDDECRNIGNSECVEGVCACKSAHYLHDDNCVAGLGACVNGSCSFNNSVCFLNASCVCRQGYFLSDGACVAELGMDATQCQIQGSNPSGSSCYCRSYWFQDDTNRACYKSMTQENAVCQYNVGCYAMGPNSFCNVTAGKGTCLCSSFAQLDEDSYACEASGEQQTECLSDEGCEYMETCLDEKCECVDDFKRNDNGTCEPMVAGSCEVLPCSSASGARCAAGVCACPSDLISETVDGVGVCLRKADDLHDPCQVDAQCVDFQNSVCAGDGAANKTCVCAASYVEVELDAASVCMARKEFGSTCMKSTDCTLVLNQSFQCRNNLCQCPVGSKEKNGYCASSGSPSHFVSLGLVFASFLVCKLL